jgi:hypothetical protein
MVEGQDPLMAIDHAGDSLLDLKGGFVTLTSLADSLSKNRMPAGQSSCLVCVSQPMFRPRAQGSYLYFSDVVHALCGTEGPTLSSLSREMDTRVYRPGVL